MGALVGMPFVYTQMCVLVCMTSPKHSSPNPSSSHYPIPPAPFFSGVVSPPISRSPWVPLFFICFPHQPYSTLRHAPSLSCWHWKNSSLRSTQILCMQDRRTRYVCLVLGAWCLVLGAWCVASCLQTVSLPWQWHQLRYLNILLPPAPLFLPAHAPP